MIIEEIINDIVAYKQDHPEVIITESLIKSLLQEHEKEIINEIKEGVEQC